MDALMIYRIILGFLAIAGMGAIMRSRNWGMFVLGVSLFIQRYNIYFPGINRSLQLSFIFIAVFILRELALLLREGILKSKAKAWWQKVLDGAGYVWKSLWAHTFFRWLLIMWGASAVTLIWGYDRLQGVIELVLRALTFGTAFLVYWVGMKSDETIIKAKAKATQIKKAEKTSNASVNLPLEFLFSGLIVGGLLDFLLTLAQQFDCLWNQCQFFLIFDHVTLGIRGLAFTEQWLSFDNKLFFRSMGNFGDVNMHGFMVLTLCLLFVSLIIRSLSTRREPNVVNREVIFYGFGAILMLGVGISTISRSAIFSFVLVATLSVLTFLLVRIWRIKDIIKKIIVVVGLVILSGLVIYVAKLIYIEYTPHEIKVFIEARLNIKEESSAVKHFDLIKEAYEVGKGSNYLGVGVGSYYKYYEDNYDLTIADNDPHSWPAKQFAEEGALGIIVYSSFWIWCGVLFLKFISVKFSERWLDWADLCGLIFIVLIPLMFLLGMAVYYGFYLPMVWIWVGISKQKLKLVT